jgi:hypothetical protein
MHSLCNREYELQGTQVVKIHVVIVLIESTLEYHGWFANGSTTNYHLYRSIHLFRLSENHLNVFLSEFSDVSYYHIYQRRDFKVNLHL